MTIDMATTATAANMATTAPRSDGGHMEPARLIETLTGCAPQDVARSCDTEDLRLARLLIEEALDLQFSGPRLQVVPAVRAG